MFRTLCPECAKMIEEKAAQSEKEKDVLILGCSHNKVGISVLVNGGLIVGWNLWPVNDEESFRDRAVIQLALMHEFMGMANGEGTSNQITRH